MMILILMWVRTVFPQALTDVKALIGLNTVTISSAIATAIGLYIVSRAVLSGLNETPQWLTKAEGNAVGLVLSAIGHVLAGICWLLFIPVWRLLTRFLPWFARQISAMFGSTSISDEMSKFLGWVISFITVAIII